MEPYGYPTYNSPPPTTQMPPPAGFWVRALARIVDSVVINIVNSAAIFLTVFFAQMWATFKGLPPGTARALTHFSGAELLAGLLGALAYQTFMEGIYGASVGKILFGLHVFSIDGNQCTMGCAFVRSLAYFVDSLFFGIVALIAMSSSPLRQRLGDRWAHSVVVNLKAVGRPPTDWGLFFKALFWAIVSCGVLSTITIWARILAM